jgi:hypothetical protein
MVSWVVSAAYKRRLSSIQRQLGRKLDPGALKRAKIDGRVGDVNRVTMVAIKSILNGARLGLCGEA